LKNASVSFRLTFWFSTIFLCGFVLFGVVMWADLAYSLSKGRDRTLVRRATRFVELLRSTRGESQPVREAQFARVAEVTPEGHLIEIYTLDGKRFLPRDAPPGDFPWPAVKAVSRPEFSNADMSGRPYRVLKFPVPTVPPVVILVAGQLDDNRNMMARFTMGLAGAIPVMLVLSAMCGYFLGRRVLQPVDQITAALHSINIGNLSRRLPVSETGDELQRLAQTCNQMLERLQDAVDRINRFTADASHELRSPVALIRAVAEYELRNPNLDRESKEAFGEILAESVDASLLLEDMLTLARADAGFGTPVFEPMELEEVVKEVGARLGPLAEAKKQSVTVRTSGPAWISGERVGVRRLLSILLDNAIKYTAAEGRIEVELATPGPLAVVTVRDNGIGIPEALLPRIFERFARADPSRGEVSGAGLGLAIAKWIAGVHAAALTAESREQQGSVFRVEFPLVAAPASEAGQVA
jgi:signal transduction histidine kinase